MVAKLQPDVAEPMKAVVETREAGSSALEPVQEEGLEGCTRVWNGIYEGAPPARICASFSVQDAVRKVLAQE